MTIETFNPSPLIAEMEYARTVASASMLPDAYRGKPADIMLAVGLGQSMGLSPAESLYRIAVIKGKPTASAELIAANVRKAGHRLRILTDEAARSVTAVIFRADDPDFAFEVTRDMAWAQSMGLANNDNYKKQALTMLQWRAITAVARLACPEALYGVAYTPDEIIDGEPVQAAPTTSANKLRSALGTVTVEQVENDPAAEPAESPLLDTNSALAKRMFASMNEAGVKEKEDRLALCTEVAGREITTSAELTEDEARAVIREVTGEARAQEIAGTES